MKICTQCRVELEIDMKSCPLCKTPAGSEGPSMIKEQMEPVSDTKHVVKHLLWQVTSLFLVSGIVATLTIDLSMHHAVTWSIYPVTVCLIVFSYASVMALWHTKVIFQLLIGWLLSTVVLGIIQRYIQADWIIELAFPMLCAVNLIGLPLVITINHLRVKGLNILTIFFLAVATLCLVIEGIISYYFTKVIELQWSVIVAACLVPVSGAIVFMHLRTKNNVDLQKIFHT